MHRTLLLLLTALFAQGSHAADYAYVGGLYNAGTITNNTTCGPTQQCGQFTASQRISGYFSTAAPLPPNLASVDIRALLSGYAFGNGVISIGMGDSAARAHTFRVSTDGVGNITSATVVLERWTDPANAPHAAGARFNIIGFGGLGDGTNINAFCTAPATTSLDGTTDVCDSPGTDSGTSSANGSAGAAWVNSPPSISINSVSIPEGNAGTTNMTFTVSLSATPTANVSVRWATSDNTATAGTDYIAASGTLNWIAGDGSQKQITVPINGDTSVEPDETFLITLDSPVGATLGTMTGTGTIQNDDVAPRPTVSINNVSLTEMDAGTPSFTFTVQLSATPTAPVSLNWATSDGTATAGSDYIAASGTLTWAAGDGVPKTIVIYVNGDTQVEPDETFFVTLSNLTGTDPGNVTGTGTILNDDMAPPVGATAIPTLSEWGLMSLGALLVLATAAARRWSRRA